jgi:hypothetical protein
MKKMKKGLNKGLKTGIIAVIAVLVVGAVAVLATNGEILQGRFTLRLFEKPIIHQYKDRPWYNYNNSMVSTVVSPVPSTVPSEVPSDVTSEVSSDVTSEVPSDVTSEVSSNVTSIVVSEGGPSEVTSQVPSDVTSEVPSSVTSEVPSDVTSDVPSSVTSTVVSPVASAVPVPKSLQKGMNIKKLPILTAKVLLEAAKRDYKENPARYILTTKETLNIIKLYEAKDTTSTITTISELKN